LKAKSERLGPDTASILKTISDLADLHWILKNLENAVALNKRCFRGYSKIWGPSHVLTLDSASKSAHIYQHMKQYDEAEELFRRVKLGYTEWFRASHPKVLTAAACLEDVGTSRITSAEEKLPRPTT
jgi:Tetratricopeptide repeat